MDLKQLAGVDTFYHRPDGTRVGHREFYDVVIEKLGGLNGIIPCVPFSLSQIAPAYAEDKNLNNLPLCEWDRAAGFHTVLNTCSKAGSRLTELYRKKGVSEYSCADGVCILKESARRIAGLAPVFENVEGKGTYCITFVNHSVVWDADDTVFYVGNEGKGAVEKNRDEMFDLWTAFCRENHFDPSCIQEIEFISEEDL